MQGNILFYVIGGLIAVGIIIAIVFVVKRYNNNRVGGCPLIEQPTSHTTVRTVPYTAVQ